MSRRLLSSASLLALGVCAAAPAEAACSFDNGETNVFSVESVSCTPRGASYTAAPTDPDPGVLPVPYTGFAFYASTGAAISTSENAETGLAITTAIDDAYGAWADGGVISLAGPATITTSGSGAFGFYASGGGTGFLASGSSVTVGATTAIRAVGAMSSITAAGPIPGTGVTVNASGDGSSGLVAEDGGTIDFAGGSVTVAGTGAIGAAALGEGSSLGLQNGTAVEVTGDGALGLKVLSAPGVTSLPQMKADSITVSVSGSSQEGAATGAAYNSHGVLAVSSSTLETTSGFDTFGVYTADGGKSLLTGDKISVADSTIYAAVESAANGTTIIDGGSVTANGFGSAAVYAHGAGAAVYVGYSDPLANPPVVGNPVAIATVEGNSPGVKADERGLVSIMNGTVDTEGYGSIGLWVIGSGSTIEATGTAVTTNGSVSEGSFAADGVVAQDGGHATLTGGSVTTRGAYSEGLFAFGEGSRIDATGTTIETNEQFATGVDAYNGGQVTLDGGSVTTAGVGANGLWASNSGSIITKNGMTVATSGAGANGVQADSGGAVTLGGGSVATSGDAFGLYATGAGSTISATGVVVSASGSGLPVYADQSAVITMTGGSAASAAPNTPAIGLTNSAVVNLNGVAVSTIGDGAFGIGVNSGATLNGTGVTITTSGNLDAESGQSAVGVANQNSFSEAPGGAVNLANSSILTTGFGAGGVFTGTGSTTTLTNDTIVAKGANSTGVNATGDGAVVQVIGGSVTMNGDNSPGLYASGAGSSLSASGNVAVTTTGGSSPAAVVASGGGLALGGSSLTASGPDSHALIVAGSASEADLAGLNLFSTQGGGGVGLYATAGGAITASGPVIVATTGGASASTGLAAYGVNADGAGSRIALAGATITTSGAGATGLFASDRSQSGAAGAITASGPLSITTTGAGAAGVALQGDNAAILATGGGSIAAAGAAIAFLGGANQTAIFDNFTIANQTGDLILADPSVATITFNTTTAIAGAGNLLNATQGSFVTLNASASSLTGPIQTDAASTTNVALANRSLWTMTGSSVLSNLAVSNSATVFSPNGPFKTLTVGNYVGSGAALTMNATLGDSSSQADKLVINGGTASGSTALTIRNAGGAGGQTTGAGIPIIAAINGGSIATNAFTLEPIAPVGGYKYTLNETADAWYLVSSPTSTQADIVTAFNNLGRSQQQQIITNRMMASILLGWTEQINCSNCASGFGSIGSYALGAHGRWALTDELTLMGGFSYGEYSADDVKVTNAPMVAASLVYDFVNWGKSRPFFAVGGSLTPYSEADYTRSYLNGGVVSYGRGKAISRNASVFGRVGWVVRPTPIDEAAAFVDISRNWLQNSGYTELTNAANPYPMTVDRSVGALNVARLGAQWTHLFNGNIETNVSAAVAHGFGGTAGAPADIYGFGLVAPYVVQDSTWVEYGARVGYRFGERIVVDGFVLGTLGGQIGATIHGGLGLRYLF